MLTNLVQNIKDWVTGLIEDVTDWADGKFLPLTGGTLTGNLTVSSSSGTTFLNGGNLVSLGDTLRIGNTAAANTDAYLKMATTNRNQPVISVHGATDGNGDAVVIGDGGLMVIGGGESPQNWYSRIIGTADAYYKNYLPGSEATFVTSDNNVIFVANANTVGNRRVGVFNASGFVNHVTNVDTSQAGNGISANVYDLFGSIDVNGRYGMYMQTTYYPSGMTRLTLSARNFGTGANVDNGLWLNVANDGTRSMGVSDAAMWRTALATNNAANLTTGTVPVARLTNNAWTYLKGSASTTNYVRWCRVGGVVYIEIYYESGAGLTTSAISFGTMPAGARPSREIDTSGYAGGTNDHIFGVWVMTSGVIQGRIVSGTSAAAYAIMSYPVF